jgi:monoamine oxidase
MITPSHKTDETEVAIIGAGISGLTVAHHCQNAKINYRLFEASSRVGGRIRTHYHGKQPIELGASWLHSGNINPLHNLVLESGCKLHQTSNRIHVWRGVNWLNDHEYKQYIAPYEACHQKFLHQTEQTNTNCELYATGGLEKLIKTMATSVKIDLNSPVAKINWTDNSATLTTNQGTCKAQKVIIATNAEILRRRKIIFDPPLPQHHQSSLDKLTPVCLQKLNLVLDVALPDDWKNHFLTDIDEQTFTWFVPPDSKNLMVCFHYGLGTPPLSTLTMLTHSKKNIANWIQKPFSVLHYYHHEWHHDSWQGCSHFLPLDKEAIAYLRKPIGPILLAGDYLHQPLPGQMGGAYLIAKEICASL